MDDAVISFVKIFPRFSFHEFMKITENEIFHDFCIFHEFVKITKIVKIHENRENLFTKEGTGMMS